MIGTVFLHRVHLFAGAHTHLLLSLLETIHGVLGYRCNIQWCELGMKLNTYI